MASRPSFPPHPWLLLLLLLLLALPLPVVSRATPLPALLLLGPLHLLVAG